MRSQYSATPSSRLDRLIIRPFQEFANTEAAGGIVLLAMAAVALVWANSPFADGYFHLWEMKLTIGGGAFTLSKTLHHWINDGLMAIFFFVVGLEIKREVLVGELSTGRRAALPAAGALGGMLVPAALYFALNPTGVEATGWGIPMATDIAFALGVLALLGDRAPLGLKVFLTALAIVDDLGAVLVIALFYTAELSLGSLAVAGGLLLVAITLNRSRVRHPLPYALVGIGVWLGFLSSGVHATVAGVLMAMTIPARRRIDDHQFVERARALIDEIARDTEPGVHEPTTDQRDAIHALERACEHVDTPLERLEHALLPWVAFFIMPLFALANAGVQLVGGAGMAAMDGGIVLGIVIGLVLGKQLGVTAFAWAAVKAGWAELPQGVSMRQLYGVSWLAGIGFTMSLFIGTLAFADAALLASAKVGILAASLIAGIGGWLLIARGGPPERATA